MLKSNTITNVLYYCYNLLDFFYTDVHNIKYLEQWSYTDYTTILYSDYNLLLLRNYPFIFFQTMR